MSDSEHEVDLSEPSGVARCAPLDGQTEPYTVHGVAIGEGDTTYGENGPKFWPAEELRAATQSLVGVPLTKNHDDDRVESVIGEVVDAGYEAGLGVVFEAEVDDEEIATKIARGRLEVSIHALHTRGGQTQDGEMIVENVRFADLSVVPRGASPTNYVEAGPSEALASLSADEMSELIGHESDAATSHDSTMTDTDSEPTDEAPEAEAEASEANADTTEADEADVEEAVAEDAEPDTGDADEAEASEDVDEASNEEAKLRGKIEELRAENEELRQELHSVRLEYADTLAEASPFEAEELAERFTFDELQERFEESEASLTGGAEVDETSAPAPRTGSADTEEELSSTSDDEAEEIAELEQKVENYDEMGWDAAKARAEERLEQLRS
jgi:hypothetical protein